MFKNPMHGFMTIHIFFHHCKKLIVVSIVSLCISKILLCTKNLLYDKLMTMLLLLHVIRIQETFLNLILIRTIKSSKVLDLNHLKLNPHLSLHHLKRKVQYLSSLLLPNVLVYYLMQYFSFQNTLMLLYNF